MSPAIRQCAYVIMFNAVKNFLQTSHCTDSWCDCSLPHLEDASLDDVQLNQCHRVCQSSIDILQCTISLPDIVKVLSQVA